MQLRPKKRKISSAIAKASLSLLCASAQLAQAQEVESSQGFFSKNADKLSQWAKWSGEIGFLGYSETNGRVQAWEPAIKLNAEFDGERVWSTRLVFDSLTGASPNGAINSAQPQTFTSPSGSASYTVAPGTQPLYDQFKDTRVSLLTSWSAPLVRLWKYSVGFNGSKEYDYLSLGVNTSLTKESEDKNQSWTVGLSYTSDTITPVGGVPLEKATMVPPLSAQPKSSTSESKSTLDVLMGFTQVITRDWIVQTNLSLGMSSGYMSEPYKFVTIFDDVAGATLGDPTSYIYESRPDTRFKRSIYVASKNAWSAGYTTASYRFLNDDWGLNSHTLEASYNFSVGGKWRLEPGFRYYKQSAVDFYRLAVGQGAVMPEYVTADYRVGDLTTMAPSVKIIRKLENDKELSLILRYYQQTGDASSFSPVGSQIGQDLIPKTDAYIVQVHYSF
jgi:hypothetical protein